MKRIARWVAVVPVAFICALLVAFPIHWLVMIIHGSPDHALGGIPPRVLEYGGYAFFLPLIFVFVGGAFAPSHRFQTSIVLGCLWLLFVVGMIVLSVSAGGQIIWWTVPVSGALTITALVLAVIGIKRADY